MIRRSAFQRFTTELRRRHVPQTAAVYIVAAWAAIQFADVVVPNLGGPEWVVQAVIIAAGLGLPVVLVLAWMFDRSPEGLRRTQPESEPASEPGPEPAPRPEPGVATGPARADRPVPAAAPDRVWMPALGVLVVGIASALGVALLLDRVDADDGGASAPAANGGAGAGAGDGAPRPPEPPQLVMPGLADSLRHVLGDSAVRGLEGLDELIEMATRMGVTAGSEAARGALGGGGPVTIEVPETWRVGAPEPVESGDTLRIRGVARGGEARVQAVEVAGRVVARAGADGAAELAFEASWVAGPGRGLQSVPVVVRLADGERVERAFGVIVLPENF